MNGPAWPGQRSLQRIAALKISGATAFAVHLCVAGGVGLEATAKEETSEVWSS